MYSFLIKTNKPKKNIPNETSPPFKIYIQGIGVWFNTEKDAKVEIYKCGDKYCGKIIWLKFPNNEEGTPKMDKNNPDDKLKKRAVLGLNLLSGFS